MNWITTLGGWLKVAWPIISMILGALSAAHANASHEAAKAGTVSISSQAVNVAGAGTLGAVGLLAGACGVVSNHRAASSAPSKAPEGVDQVLHQLDVAHSALVAAKASEAEFDGLNALIKLRLKTQPPVPKVTP